MKILYFDFSTGASGDKILGALIDVCENLNVASFKDIEHLGGVLVPDAKITRRVHDQGGIQASGIVVTENAPTHRHWHNIRELVESARKQGALSKRALELSLTAFSLIAEAEAKVHGVGVEQVHFHEVGAADSIIDICCSCFLLDRLAPAAVYASPLALGFGTFMCSHGELPVPAPATALIIEGLPVYAGVHAGELTTPTGAALATIFVSNWQPLPHCVPHAVGYGGGTRTIKGASNVVRVLAAELLGLSSAKDPAPLDDYVLEGCALLETNIDHLSPEALAYACEELMSRGALDVWQESITMKKGRLAVRLCVLATAVSVQEFAVSIIELTGSLGVRSSFVERVVVRRKLLAKETAYGSVAYKTALIATASGSIKLQRPEYEDVARIAREQGLDFNTLYKELL